MKRDYLDSRSNLTKFSTRSFIVLAIFVILFILMIIRLAIR